MITSYLINAFLADEAVSYTKSFLGNPALEKQIVDLLKTAIHYPIAVSVVLACVGVVGAAIVSAVRVERYGNLQKNTDTPTQPLPESKSSEDIVKTDPPKTEPAATPLPAPLPNIIAVRGQIKWLPKNYERVLDDESGVYRQRLRRFQVFIAIFHNLPLSERNIGSAQNVTASIIYYYKDVEFARVTKGIWIEDSEQWRTNKVDFNPNSLRRLILASEDYKGQFFAFEDYSDSGSANVLSSAGYGSGVPLQIPTGTRCRAIVQFTIDGRADRQEYRFNLGFGENPYCGLEEDDIPFDKIPR